MARTTPMRLVELMVLKQDINSVVEFLGKRRNFQFQSKVAQVPSEKEENPEEKNKNEDSETLSKLKQACTFLGVEIPTGEEANSLIEKAVCPNEETRTLANQCLASVDKLREKAFAAATELSRVRDANEEAHSFSNLKVPFEELDRLSFLSLKIGKIDPTQLDSLKDAVGERAVIIPLSDENAGDRSKILAASSKRARFSLDTELKKFGFVELEVPKNFQGVPDEVLSSLKAQLEGCEKKVEFINEEKQNCYVFINWFSNCRNKKVA